MQVLTTARPFPTGEPRWPRGPPVARAPPCECGAARRGALPADGRRAPGSQRWRARASVHTLLRRVW